MVVRRKITSGKKVGKWKDGKYSRYKQRRNPSSGIEFVRRSKNVGGHVYGSDRARRRRIVGEGRRR